MAAMAPCSLRDGPSSQAPQGLSPGVMSAIGKVQKAIRKAQDDFALNTSVTGGVPLQSLAEAISRSSFLVTMRTGLPLGCESPDYLSTLRHSFLIVQEHNGPSADLCIVVDPAFREQFVCNSMPASSVYAQTVANNVPQFFVGTIGTVNALVCLLQSTLAEEAQALGVELPPWRSRSALLSKWLPRRFTDAVFMPPALEANLHPLLKSSLAGVCPGAGSPTGVQSWQSSQRPSLSSSHASSSDGCSSSVASERPSPSRPPQPQTVVIGFAAAAAAPAAAAADAACSCGFRASPSSSSSCSSSSSPRAAQHRSSALSQQLAAAAEAARCVQVAAADQWARLEELAAAAQQQRRPAAPAPVLALAVTAAAPAPVPLQLQAPQPAAFRSSGGSTQLPRQEQQQQAEPAADAPAQAQQEQQRQPAAEEDALAKLEVAWSTSGGSGSGGTGQLLQALVVSPVHRRTVVPASSGSSSLRRSGAAAGGGCASLKLAGAPLKQLPRIYTVKLAVAAC